jgi:hypothetical protein
LVVVLLLLPPPFLVLVLMQVLVLLVMPLVLVHLLLLLSLLVLLPLLATAAVLLCSLLCTKEQHDVIPHTPYTQLDSKYLPPPKRNVRALQLIKVKIYRRVMCPWGGEKRKRRHRRRCEKHCVCGKW